MPSPVVAPSPAAALMANAAAPQTEGMSTSGATADSTQATPFAALLRQQLATQGSTEAGELPLVDVAAEAIADLSQADQFDVLSGQGNMAFLTTLPMPVATDKFAPGQEAAETLPEGAALPTDPLGGAPMPIAMPFIAADGKAAANAAPIELPAGAESKGQAILAAAIGKAADTSRDAMLIADATQKGDGMSMEPTTGEQPFRLPDSGAALQVSQAANAGRHAEMRLEATVGTPRWNGEFSDKLAWMVGRNEQRAELVLNPPQLGRVEVSISITGEQANATFVSPNPAVREAIENALPRLREVFAEAGIALGQAQVGAESPGQSPGRGENGDNRAQARIAEQQARPMQAGMATTSQAVWQRGGRGMVDVFA